MSFSPLLFRVRDSLLSNEHGWLQIHPQGPYGHARTLHVKVALPPGAASAGLLRFVWRLEHFTAALDLGPLEPPFPLGVRVSARTLLLLSPYAQPDFESGGLCHTVQNTVSPGVWMAHEAVLAPDRPEPRQVEFQVRALDIALSIGCVEWNGRPLFPRVFSAAPTDTPTESV